MLKRIRAALGRVVQPRGGPRHRAHDPRDASRYRAGGDVDIAKGQARNPHAGGLPPGGQPPSF